MGIFTEFVMEIGRVRSIDLADVGAHITFEAREVLERTRIGDSIAINGVDLKSLISVRIFSAQTSQWKR